MSEALAFAMLFAENRDVRVDARAPDVLTVETRFSALGRHRSVVTARVDDAPRSVMLNCAHLVELTRALDDDALAPELESMRALAWADGHKGFLAVFTYFREEV